MKQHPAEFETLFCYEGNLLTTNVEDNIVTPMFDPVRSDRQPRQELIIMYWRDYLQDTEGDLNIKILLHSTNNGKFQKLKFFFSFQVYILLSRIVVPLAPHKLC